MKKLFVIVVILNLLAISSAYTESIDVGALSIDVPHVEELVIDNANDLTEEINLDDAVEIDLVMDEMGVDVGKNEAPDYVSANSDGYVAIDWESFPDNVFRNYVLENIDKDGDAYLSGEERLAVTELEINSMNISSLEGIEHFIELKKLYCGNNLLTELDVSKNVKLEELECGENKINELDVRSNVQLISLGCEDNVLAQLKIGRCSKLRSLTCENNKLKKLDVALCVILDFLECQNNALQSLSLNHNLTYLDCSDNVLSDLDVSYNRQLKWFSCTNNNISSLIFHDCADLTYIFCSYNKLSSLTIGKCPKLERLFCNSNRLKTLDVSKCTGLEMLRCNDNQLKKITLGKSQISDLYCQINKLKTVDISGCPYLKGEVTCIISGIDKRWGTVHWGSIYDDYEGRETGNAYIEIDKGTTLKNGKKVLYKTWNPKSIKFTRSSGTLKKKSFVNLGKYIKMSPTGVASVCKLSSSNKKVVRVYNSGYIYGLKKGTATITVKTANGKKARIKVTVK